MLRLHPVVLAVAWALAAGIADGIAAKSAAAEPKRPLGGREFDPEMVEIADLLEAAEFEEAGARATELLARLEAADPPDSLAIAQVLELRTEYYVRSGQAQRAEARADVLRALAIRNAVHGEGEPETASSLRFLGILDFMQGDLGAARESLERVLEIRAGAGEPRDFVEASVVNNLALIAWQSGDLPEAELRLREAIEILSTELGPEHSWVVLARQNLGLVLSDLAQYEEAETELEQAVELGARVLGPRHPERARGLGGLGFLQYRLGDYGSAVVHIEESLSIRTESLGPEHPDTAWDHRALALVWMQIGDLDSATEHARRALVVREAALGPENVLVAADCAALAEALFRADAADEAFVLAERRIVILDDLGISGSELAWAHLDLGSLLAREERRPEARLHFEHARELWRESGHPDEWLARQHLAGIDLADGKTVQARAELEACRGPVRGILGDVHPRVAEIEGLIALAAFREGDLPDARDHALEAERIAREHLRLTARGLEERQARGYAVWRVRGLDLATLVELQDPASSRRSTLDAVIRSRSVVLDEVAERQTAYRETEDPALVARREEVAEARTRLANLLARGPSDTESDYGDVLAIALARKDRAERGLARSSDVFRALAERTVIGLEEVEARLGERAALVSYVSYRTLEGERAFAAYILRGGEAEPVVVGLGSAEALEEAVARWREEAAHGEHDLTRTSRQSEVTYREAGARLRRIVWDPLVPYLSGRERVHVVPDGVLHLVSLATLPDDDAGYLVEAGPVLQFLSTERDLVPAEGSRSGRGILALGGADHDAVDTGPIERAAVLYRGAPADCATFRDLRFAPLPATVREVQEIAGQWPGGDARARTGSAASEACFKAESSGREILHLAVHGFFLGDDCGDAAGRAETAATLHASPLLLSGVALAGANRRADATDGEEDGVLTAEEIVSLDLAAVDWAVLSGCDTALGSVDPVEGVHGLRRAFLLAGVRSIVMSLWAVEDESALAWMRALYRARSEVGADAAAAVHRASRERLEARRRAGESTHPFHWGAFVAVGG